MAPTVLPVDLTVGDIDVSNTTFDSQALELGGSVNLEVVNVGLGDVADSFDVALFEDRNANGSFEAAVDNVLGTITHEGGLTAGASIFLDAEVSGVLEFFANPIHAFVDSANAIVESREDNNVGNTDPACSFQPPVPGPLTPAFPHRFEAGTPAITEAIGLGAAIDYINAIGLENISAHEQGILQYATERLTAVDGLRIIGTAKEKASIVSFLMDGIHAHDLGTFVDRAGVAVRVGHHCAQPVMERFGVAATARASFGLYNTRDEVNALTEALDQAKEFFG